MNKLYDRIDFHNSTEPALNESNLNAMSKGIDDIDDRVVDLGTAVLETVPELEKLGEEIEKNLDEIKEAGAKALIAEGFSVGQQNGEDVDPDSPYYHNNAKYYSDQSNPTTLASLTDVDVSGASAGKVLKYDGTKWKAGEGGGSGASDAKDVAYDNTSTHMSATNVQDALDSVFQSVSNGKSLIADAISDKGVETSATDTFAVMAQHISEISSGAGGGQSYNKFYDQVGGTKTDTFTSTMNGKLKVLACGYMDEFAKLKINGTEIAPTASYYNTSRYAYGAYFEINVNKDDVIVVTGTGTGDSYYSLLCSIVGDGMDINDTTAIESDVASGKIFHKADGSRAVGTSASKGAKSGTFTLTTSDQEIDCGFAPSQVIVCVGANRTTYFGFGINTNGATVGSRVAGTNATSATTPATITLTSNGFKAKAISSSYALASTYTAIE